MLGKYRIVAELERGGMATVCKGCQTSLNRYVAIKVLPPCFQHTSDFIARFMQEALSAAKLQHPKIVQIYDASESTGYHYVVMEYVDGESLHAFMLWRGGSLDLQTTLSIFSQVAPALD